MTKYWKRIAQIHYRANFCIPKKSSNNIITSIGFLISSKIGKYWNVSLFWDFKTDSRKVARCKLETFRLQLFVYITRKTEFRLQLVFEIEDGAAARTVWNNLLPSKPQFEIAPTFGKLENKCYRRAVILKNVMQRFSEDHQFLTSCFFQFQVRTSLNIMIVTEIFILKGSTLVASNFLYLVIIQKIWIRIF